jgi:hypothetical protein
MKQFFHNKIECSTKLKKFLQNNKTTREDDTIEVLTPWLFIEVFIKPLM